ncbi:hypothetical protein DB88DRAFT_538583 [Papiliotrema laurentii]|uniref:Uncharacterized protein n=1 Tax=Papiliotrema laurentii TaxID=5418 RepID=A0AAD9FV23_PAPLA|nr:hypothetical protein DB88DRAFT_538583 [Papiliotrema laurentii]
MSDAHHSPTTITVVPLPQLPHPSTLATSSAFLIHEAQKTYNELSTLRQNIVAESSTYVLDPPGSSSLPPLPPIPVPPSTSHRKPSSLATPSPSSLPTAKPTIPSSSPLHNAVDVKSCCESLRTSGHRAEERYDSTALWVVIDSISAWILLRVNDQSNGVPSVRCIRLLESSKGDQPIHAQSTSAPLRALSKHLTDLSLPLPELLFRLVSLPELLKQPCHYCQRHLRVPDGLPYGQTGYLPADPSLGSKDATRMDTDQDDEVKEGGKWVSWHPSCQPIA